VARASPASTEDLEPSSLTALCLYFLRLGTIGFGGPIALVGAMQRDLVEERRWISKQDYLEGLALAQLAPGPLAAQLAIYLGWIRGRVLGATLVALAFILPSFAMVLVLSALYLRYGGLAWIQGAFYGIAAAVIAILARGAFKLARMTLGVDKLLWVCFVASAAVTAWTGTEIVGLILLSGLVVWFARTRSAIPSGIANSIGLSLFARFAGGLREGPDARTLLDIGWFFTKAGAFVFGSGLAIVPFLRGGVVGQYHWLDERQFLDAVAVAMITPGPVVITTAFIGYLVAGPAGAVVAALGVFLPCYLFVIVPAPWFRKHGARPGLRAFVQGVTSAATGAIAGAVFVLGRGALIDLTTVAICLATGVCVFVPRKLPEPIVILVAGIVGMLVHRAAAA
jgi:chromate transporter